MIPEPSTLNLVASVLIVIVVARVALERTPLELWAFGLYSMASTAIGLAALLASGAGFEIGVFLFGVAAITGAYWAAASRPHRPLDVKAHVLAAAGALALAALLVLVAVAYRWWVAPLTLLALMVVGLVVNAVIPGLRGLRTSATALAAPSAPTSSVRRQVPPVVPASQIRSTGPISIRCGTCGLAGKIASEQAGATLSCPRCKSPVRVPGPRPQPVGLGPGGNRGVRDAGRPTLRPADLPNAPKQGGRGG